MLLIVSQIIGLLAVGLYLISFQLKKRGQIVWATCISNALYVLQYILLGAFCFAQSFYYRSGYIVIHSINSYCLL